jgi:hypothetical protein
LFDDDAESGAGVKRGERRADVDVPNGAGDGGYKPVVFEVGDLEGAAGSKLLVSCSLRVDIGRDPRERRELEERLCRVEGGNTGDWAEIGVEG